MRLFHFFYDNFPHPGLILWLFPLCLLLSLSALYISGTTRLKWKWRSGLSRKVFHFLIFILVCIVQLTYALPGTFILGWAVTAVLIFSIRKGKGSVFYEGIAREQDEPHRSRYIVYSYVATFVGGVLSNLLLGRLYAVFGYLVTGIGDALAEPIGVVFGKHRYRVINFNNKKSYRSLEGSLAVFASTFLILLIGCYSMPDIFSIRLNRIIYCSIFCTIVEAASPQGWDNLLLQLAGSFSLYLQT